MNGAIARVPILLICGRLSSRNALIINKNTVFKNQKGTKIRACFMSSTSDSDESNKNKNTFINNVEERLRNKLGDQILSDESEELQPHWAALERRVKQKIPKRPGEGPQGRSSRRISAWDAENV